MEGHTVDHGPPPDNTVPMANPRAKTSYAQALQQNKSMEQHKQFMEYAKQSNSVMLHPIEGRPNYNTLYVDLLVRKIICWNNIEQY